jgi:hypothetical protein
LILVLDGSVEICFDNGNRKEVSPDGVSTKIFYYNGDWKETLKSGLVKYFYSQTKTWCQCYKTVVSSSLTLQHD